MRETEGERYELLFGDGVFGVPVEEPNFIDVSYLSCSGQLQTVSSFSFAGRLLDNNDNPLTEGISGVTVNSPSGGGDSIESVESVKKLGT